MDLNSTPLLTALIGARLRWQPRVGHDRRPVSAKFDKMHIEGGVPHVSCSFTSILVLPADGSHVGRYVGIKPGAIVRPRSAPAEPAGADFTTHRDYRHHHQVSPAAGE